MCEVLNPFSFKDFTGDSKHVVGSFVSDRKDRFYKIDNFDQIPPFFMTITSPSDHWLFISSTGGLTAGRRNSESSLFPYYTDDRIAENSENTGSKTIIRIETSSGYQLWEPFSNRYEGLYRIERSLSKNILGSKIMFEEKNLDLGLKFTTLWTSSPQYGIIKQSSLINISKHKQEITLLDGIMNTLPGNVHSVTQSRFSNLLDAYKRSEFDISTGLAIFSLSAELVDKAEPSESLSATTWWQRGITPDAVLLSSKQISIFRRTGKVAAESDIKGARGSFLIKTDLKIEAGQERQWFFCGEVNQNHVKITDLRSFLSRKSETIIKIVADDIENAVKTLFRIIGSNDGLQVSGREMFDVHHSANVLFNIMRGGYPVNLKTLDRDNFLDYLNQKNRTLPEGETTPLKQLSDTISHQRLINISVSSENIDLKRIICEYLPLTFSRRHGDPSRPWNLFSIDTIHQDGTPKIGYEGNWRDIFQNWEALLRSYPQFVFPVITRFLNATSADGYNPYRINSEGVDWEKPEEDDPWSNIGYWSDHQIIYLAKLLEIAEDHFPGKLELMMSQESFVFVDIPYQIKSLDDILKDPKNTIIFDEDKNRKLEQYQSEIGTDGCLLRYSEAEIVHASMIEKLLILILAKLVNFVPDGGIWMNTQRPEWNDANNALVGYGLSMVTLAYLERFIAFLLSIVDNPVGESLIHQNTWKLFIGIESILQENTPSLEKGFTNISRNTMTMQLGQAGTLYRSELYASSFAHEKVSVEFCHIRSFLKLVHKYLTFSIEVNFREDGLFHSYNRLNLGAGSAGVSHLYEMLEGQVAVLSTTELKPLQAVQILKSMKESSLFREDQNSYLLYPNRVLKGFLDKNSIKPNELERYPCLKNTPDHILAGILEKDVEGISHFSSSFKNSSVLIETVEDKRSDGTAISEDLLNDLLALYDETFNHKEFTGRSGTFFAYEGLGSIYWHMVSKLLLAVQEKIVCAWKSGEINITSELKNIYREIRSGLGYNKTPEQYGAFPFDPYSHTPSNSGAKQPGMTGQVKEEILTRLLEVGILVQDGVILFSPVLVEDDEYLSKPKDFSFYNVHGSEDTIVLSEGMYGYTICGVPVIVGKGDAGVSIYFRDGTKRSSDQMVCSVNESQSIFFRRGDIVRIDVIFPKGSDRQI
ncbi:MAG: hypothetical protein JEY99_20060 [Spirochaetales bacterium]|nr:hypothetical protein [Spirochaetales bacterium]